MLLLIITVYLVSIQNAYSEQLSPLNFSQTTVIPRLYLTTFVADVLGANPSFFRRWQIPLKIGFSDNIPAQAKENWIERIREAASLVKIPVSQTNTLPEANVRIIVTSSPLQTILSLKPLLNYGDYYSYFGYLYYAYNLSRSKGIIEIFLPAERSLKFAIILVPDTEIYGSKLNENIEYSAYSIISAGSHSDILTPSIFNTRPSSPSKLDNAFLKAEYDNSIHYGENWGNAVNKISKILDKLI